MKRWVIAAIAGVMALAPSIGQAQSKLDELIQAAKKEKPDLNYTGGTGLFGGPATLERLETAFNQKFGTKIKLSFTPGPNMMAIAQRLAEENKAGAKASSDFYLGPVSGYVLLEKSGTLREVDWSDTFPWITPEMEISKKQGVLVQTSIAAMTFNPKLLKPADAPQKYEDIVDPVKSKAWAGKLAMPPYQDVYVELSFVWPKDKVLDFTRKLVALASGFVRFSDYQRLLSGEFALMAVEGNSIYVQQQAAAAGGQIDLRVGTDPTIGFYFQLSVPKNSASPNLATLFVGFMASPEAQKIINDLGLDASHLVPGTRVANFIKDNHVNLVSPAKFVEFYGKGGDPQFLDAINQLLKR